ncbi:ribonuclease E/G [Qipengyuania flava]|uniref:Ribonuclease E n=1 Tax=Qipengyuania flava TaxID=192812 RepID=A0A5P6NCT3_9SPHN|nr:ribonuclease E/G [Qipengyuania flava]MBW3168507.1 ribonuclease E/G [Qipengyuania flava]MBY5965745.1 ribonuclease E/G [Qipengyuania flava]MBY6012069.1 ribonuclease E/G [Qipengyuania flava]MBY6026511.1 ribonuclease E/G [Qipengyuania flava]QFI63829.1 ribonuclease E/G [Qipengyuania flava]
MATRMLIDARHQEETRVAVLKGNRIEEFDFESADHKQIKGNIYLAKVTRVEPSLQAAFVDFGGNRHGFLAFSEIHPDYYQIPKEDREALLEAEAEAAEEEARLRDEEEDRGEMPGDEYDADDESSEALAEDLAEDGLEEVDTSDKDDVATIEEGQLDRDDDDDDDSEDDAENGDGDEKSRGRGRGKRGRGRRQGKGRARTKEVDEARAKRMALRRRYKIQDVIQRRQVLLVQVVKEERGNKGAALTTYLSLAGRYTVLMPNSSHGGGISRKISSASDRKRLKQVVSDLSLPRTMGLIVRTAGLSRTKPEIKRDFDYLARLWDEIRERTLSSSAPALIHSDSDLIKRAIRDIYNREIEEVVVEGEDGYKSAKQFMKLLMPSHARRVKQYSDPVPLFQRYGAEDQLKAMYDPVVQLKSGGYLVINPTEALVSIDINSGRSTKEHNIEQTALHTNLEAAREIARQLRLRDMAGLVVIDFIDQEHHSNTRKVEKAMKEALKNDRARIQVGRISSFGLMEMSRQRLRTGVLEATTRECPHCDGTGLVRTASSAGLSALRLIEDEAAKGKGSVIRLAASTEAAVYLLNEKRAELMEIEQRYHVTVEVVPEGEDEGAKMTVSSHGPKPKDAPRFDPIVDDEIEDEVVDESVDEDSDDGDDDRPRKKRRRRRGGRGRNKSRDRNDEQDSDDSDDDADADRGESGEGDEDDDRSKKRRRRGGRRRGGRGRGRRSDEVNAEDAEQLEQVSEAVVEDMAVVAGPEDSPETAEAAADSEEKPKPKKRAPRKKKAAADSEAATDTAADGETEEKPKPKKRAPRKKKSEAESVGDSDAPSADAEAEAKPAPKKRAPRKKKADAETVSESPAEPQAAPETPEETPVAAEPAPAPAVEESAEAPAEAPKPKRGWWQRTFGDE